MPLPPFLQLLCQVTASGGRETRHRLCGNDLRKPRRRAGNGVQLQPLPGVWAQVTQRLFLPPLSGIVLLTGLSHQTPESPPGRGPVPRGAAGARRPARTEWHRLRPRVTGLTTSLTGARRRRTARNTCGTGGSATPARTATPPAPA